jgi:hypothetical protein
MTTGHSASAKKQKHVLPKIEGESKSVNMHMNKKTPAITSSEHKATTINRLTLNGSGAVMQPNEQS